MDVTWAKAVYQEPPAQQETAAHKEAESQQEATAHHEAVLGTN